MPCLWFFQIRSIHSNPRDLNLNCWEARIFGPKHIYIYWKTCDLPDVSIHIFTTSIRTRNVCPESSEMSTWALPTTAEILADILSSDSSSLAYWSFHWIKTVLKPYILPQRHKRLISLSKKLNYSVAERPALRSLMIVALRLYALNFNIAAILRILLFTRSRLSRMPTTSDGGTI